MIVRELITKLGFTTDPRGRQQYDNALNGMAAKAERTAAGIRTVLAGLASAFGVAMAAGAVARAGDAMTYSLQKIESSIGKTATSASEAAALYEEMREVSRRTGVSANQTASAFVNYNLAMQALGRPARETITLLEGIQAAGIIAGSSVEDVAGTVRQLGQALGKDKLNGDELVRLAETMPVFMRAITEDMGLTVAQFYDQAQKGLLTGARLIPALMAAGARARAQLANQPATMALSYVRLRNAVEDFTAELDKALGISRRMTGAFAGLTGWLDQWRAYLPTLTAFADQLGGVDQLVNSLAYSLGLAVAGLIAFRTAAILAWAAAAAPLALVGAAVIGFGVLIQDFVSWMNGNTEGSLFGRRFGDFDEATKNILPTINAIEKAFSDSADRAGSRFRSAVERIKEFLADLDDAFNRSADWAGVKFQSMADAVKQAFTGVFDWITGKLDALVATFTSAMDRIRGVLGMSESGGTGTDPEVQSERRRRMGGRGSLGGFPDPSIQLQNFNEGAAGRIAPRGASPISANQNIQQNITINATGVSAGEVAAGAQAGVARGNAHGGGAWDAFGRSLGVANPRTEAGAA